MALTTNNNVTYQLKDDTPTENGSSYDYYADYGDPGLDPQQICVMFIYIIIIVLGFIGNSLVIFAICKRGRQNVTSLLLCSLALSDLAMVLIFMPFQVVNFFIFGDWIFGKFLCKLISYISLVTPSCSGCMLMIISLERYIVILFPLKARSFLTKTRAIIIVIAAWVLSLLLGIPAIIYQKYIHHEDEGDDWYQCRKIYPRGHEKFYAVYGFICLYLLPLCVMGFSYARVILALYTSATKLKGLQQSSNISTTTDKQNNIYKPPPFKNENNAIGEGPSSDNSDPFANPDAQGQQPLRSSADTCTPSATSTQNKTTAKERKGKKGQVTLNDRRQVIVMLMVVVLLYAVCWGPLLLTNIFIRYGLLQEFNTDTTYYLSMVAHILAFTNSTVNPIVYCFMSRNFRRTVITAVKSCRGGGNSNRNSAYSSTCNSRYYSTTCNSVTQNIYVKRDPPATQTIEMTSYQKLPTSDN